MEKILDNTGKLLAVIVSPSQWKRGLDFITEDEEFIQVGTWNYDKGKVLDRHFHNIVSRSSQLTQECVVVMTGSMIVKIYDDEQAFICEKQLMAGDFAVLLAGGHGYEIQEDDTRIIETKNGPFLGVDLDKTRF